jgi:hypothetical protein
MRAPWCYFFENNFVMKKVTSLTRILMSNGVPITIVLKIIAQKFYLITLSFFKLQDRYSQC